MPTRARATVAAAAAAAVILSSLVGALAAPAGADPIDDARRARDDAQASAVAAVQRYTDALSEQARQEAEIARLVAEIPVLRARAVELRQQVRERAIVLYQQGTAMPLSRMVDAGSVVDAARAIQLTQTAAGHDQDVAAELTQTAAKLERDEAELRARKAAQDELVVRLADERVALEAALASTQDALTKVEAVAASQAAFDGADVAASGRVRTGASVCPIYGPVAFVNDWGAPRSGGRTHQGNDLFAPYGTPDLAVISGTIRWDFDDLGGNGIWLDGDDGVSYYYAHLSKFEGPPRRVARAEVIGYVGDSGNAAGGPPHTHFGMRAGGQMVNPYPTVRALCGN
jgi:peptidoglycan LD-endopeptidase LytH